MTSTWAAILKVAIHSLPCLYQSNDKIWLPLGLLYFTVRKHSDWKRTILKIGLRVKKAENAALPILLDGKSIYFQKRWRHHPTPRPLASDLWTPRCLITTTTIADYCLCLCLLQLTCLVVECESQQQFNLIIDLHKRFWFPCTSHFHLLLLLFRFSFYCLLSPPRGL